MEGTPIVALEPEERVLLHTARLQLGAQGSTKLERLLTSELDWGRLVDKADWYETAALLLHHLEASGQVEVVPEPVLSRLNAIKLEQRVRFFFFLQPELLRVLEGMGSAGVEIIPLKGAFLMNTVYPEVSLRPVGDLDLLAREKDLPRAMETLAELGYRSKTGSEMLPRGADEDYHYCPRALSPDGAVEIELHRHVVRRQTPLYFPVERFWERSAGGEIEGRPARVLAGRDLVTHLCLAFFLDRRRRTRGYGSLRQLVDLSESIRHFELDIDWEGMTKEYTGEALQAPLYVALRAAQELLGAPVPAEFLQTFKVRNLDEELFGHFLRLKVLNEGYWFLHELVDPKDNHWWNMSKAALHRLIPPASYLRDKYRLTHDSAADRLLWNHFRDGSRAALGACKRPRAMIQELRADFWMNQLQL
ncbi:MAG: nucleotidyltransferase family protein [Thermoanaerobaculia bacterium]|jgi:hypothetical protein